MRLQFSVDSLGRLLILHISDTIAYLVLSLALDLFWSASMIRKFVATLCGPCAVPCASLVRTLCGVFSPIGPSSECKRVCVEQLFLMLLTRTPTRGVID